MLRRHARAQAHSTKSGAGHLIKTQAAQRKSLELQYSSKMPGVTTTLGGSILLQKDANNSIGISIGGGLPCPALYVVQVFDKSPAALDGTLQSGDEITGINGRPVKGMTRVELVRSIQSLTGQLRIHYNKLNLDPNLLGASVDIAMKKVKHRIVEKMAPSTADLLGLSRAILCNDDLVAKLKALETKGELYRHFVTHLWKLTVKGYDLATMQKQFGDVFTTMATREPSPQSSEALRSFGQIHLDFEKSFTSVMPVFKKIIVDLKNFFNCVLPDMRATVKKYANAKFEYLSYCLKVKEMEDEESFFTAIREPLYRVETGNLEYRHAVRLRQMARTNFANLRYDVQVKLELLESKHVERFVEILQQFVASMEWSCAKGSKVINEATVFPIEVDLEALISKTYAELSLEDETENPVKVDKPQLDDEILGGDDDADEHVDDKGDDADDVPMLSS